MKTPIAAALLFCAPMFAAITGTAINRTTGQPQPGATVALDQMSEQGVAQIDQTKTDAQGKFTLNQNIQGPHLLRVEYEGVTYNRLLTPGAPTTGMTIDVYNASRTPGAAKVSKHMLLFEPSSNGQMVVNETFLLENSGQTTWNDSKAGTLRFYVPKGAKPDVKATAPAGMPIGASLVKTSKSDEAAVDFPVKPGETRFDINYTVPYKEGAPYEGKIVTQDENSYLIAPNGITMTGAGLNDLGQEPRTQARIYGFSGTTYKISMTGTEVAAAPADTSGDQAESSGPQIDQILPRIYGKAPLILGLALGILALGFVALYRSPETAPKESNERGRR